MENCPNQLSGGSSRGFQIAEATGGRNRPDPGGLSPPVALDSDSREVLNF